MLTDAANRRGLRTAWATVIVLCWVCSPPQPVVADDATTSTAEILAAGGDVGCLDWKVAGMCIWMTCTILDGCSIETTVKYRHRIPEYVVTSYPSLGRGPWSVTNAMAQPTSFAQDGGASDEGGSNLREQVLKFKNAEMIGSPSNAIYERASSTSRTFCNPNSTPYSPHFISSADPFWRDPLLETPWTLRYIASGVRVDRSWFAGLYPRIGFVSQNHDYKASLVSAVRAVSITQDPGIHVARRLPSGGGRSGYWPPSRSSAFSWQQLTPNRMGCRRLPDIDDTTRLTDPYSGRLNQSRGNAWQLWRRYACCERAGTTLIFHSG
ncbi:MAG: TraU family protein [Pseudomonadota bacterium]